MPHSDIIVLSVLLAGIIFSINWKKLTVPAALTGGVLGWAVYAGGGFTGLAMMTTFFVLGTSATSWKKDQKLPIRSNAAHESTRTARQVIANAGIAAIAGLLIVLFPAHRPLLLLMTAASLASATADTLSSELGMVYGRRFYHILSWRQDQKGLDGVISIEGLLIGVAGAAIIAFVFALGQGWTLRIFGLIVLSGTLGNLIDSVLGASFERKGWLTNDAVNFLNTLAAALAAGALEATHVFG